MLTITQIHRRVVIGATIVVVALAVAAALLAEKAIEREDLATQEFQSTRH